MKIISQKKLPKNEALLEVSIPWTTLEETRGAVLKNLNQEIKIPGFRSGHIPEKILLEQIGEEYLWQEMAEKTLRKIYPKIIEEAKLNPLTPPDIKIKKLAPQNPLEIEIGISLFPEFSLPNYQKIADEIIASEKANELKIEDIEEKEVQDLLSEIHKIRTGTDQVEDAEEISFPSFDDNFAKKLGDFKNLEELKNRLRQNLILEKKHRQKEKARALFLEKIIKETPLEISDRLIKEELEHFLNHHPETKEEEKEEAKKQIEEKLKLEFIIEAIFKKENISLSDETLETSLVQLKQTYPDQPIDQNRLRNFLLNETFFQKILKEEKD